MKRERIEEEGRDGKEYKENSYPFFGVDSFGFGSLNQSNIKASNKLWKSIAFHLFHSFVCVFFFLLLSFIIFFFLYFLYRSILFSRTTQKKTFSFSLYFSHVLLFFCLLHRELFLSLPFLVWFGNAL